MTNETSPNADRAARKPNADGQRAGGYGSPQIHFRAGDLLAALAARTGPRQGTLSGAARRDLDRYYRMLHLALSSARLRLTVAEASLVVDVLNGTLTEPHTASLLYAEVAEALEDGVAEKWGVDGPGLVTRLQALTAFEALALADAAERFWLIIQRTPGADRVTALRAVGLVPETNRDEPR